MQLHNRVNREELKQRMQADVRSYTTISFYKYHPIQNVPLFRDHLYIMLQNLEVVGRIYVAHEGINAQIALPSVHLSAFKEKIAEITFLENNRLNIAVEEKNKPSFYKLDVKIRHKIVADGIDDPEFNPSNTGKYLNAAEWNEKMEDKNTVVIDMRNHYESEVGKFIHAQTPDCDTFREELNMVLEQFAEEKNKPILMYCTGGIRCEKASAWMKYKGFSEVYHLEGGIINYVNQVKKEKLENKFIGVNFVFDDRLAERISEDVIAKCHQCGEPADTHTNCAFTGCHTLFIQCPNCATKMQGCCSEECIQNMHLPEEEQKIIRQKKAASKTFEKGRWKTNA